MENLTIKNIVMGMTLTMMTLESQGMDIFLRTTTKHTSPHRGLHTQNVNYLEPLSYTAPSTRVKGRFVSPRHLEPGDCDIFPVLADIARLNYRIESVTSQSHRANEIRASLKEEINHFMSAHVTSLYKYTDPNEKINWVMPRTYKHLQDNYQYFLMELIETLDFVVNSWNVDDEYKEFGGSSYKKHLPSFIDTIFFLFDRYNEKNENNREWVSYRKHPYHQLAQLIQNEPLLSSCVEHCVHYPSFVDAHSTYVGEKDPELGGRKKTIMSDAVKLTGLFYLGKTAPDPDVWKMLEAQLDHDRENKSYY